MAQHSENTKNFESTHSTHENIIKEIRQLDDLKLCFCHYFMALIVCLCYRRSVLDVNWEVRTERSSKRSD